MGLCCPAPSNATTAPSATFPAMDHFPGLTGYRPTRAEPSHRSGRGRLPQFLYPPSYRSTSHTPAGSSALRVQALRAFHGLRRDTPGSAPACPSFEGALTRRQNSRHAADRYFAPPKGLSTLRFDAGRFPPTPAACYRAPWRLPGPDFHRLADTGLRTSLSSGHEILLPDIACALWARYAPNSAGGGCRGRP